MRRRDRRGVTLRDYLLGLASWGDDGLLIARHQGSSDAGRQVVPPCRGEGLCKSEFDILISGLSSEVLEKIGALWGVTFSGPSTGTDNGTVTGTAARGAGTTLGSKAGSPSTAVGVPCSVRLPRRPSISAWRLRR